MKVAPCSRMKQFFALYAMDVAMVANYVNGAISIPFLSRGRD